MLAHFESTQVNLYCSMRGERPSIGSDITTTSIHSRIQQRLPGKQNDKDSPTFKKIMLKHNKKQHYTKLYHSANINSIYKFQRLHLIIPVLTSLPTTATLPVTNKKIMN